MRQLFDVQYMAQALKNNALSERRKMIYMLLVLVGIVALYEVILGAGLIYNAWSAVQGVMLVTTSALGIVSAFWANQRYKGTNFIERYICLALPAGVLSAALSIAIYIPYELTRGDYDADAPIQLTGFDFTIACFIQLFYFVVIVYGLKLAAQKKQTGQ